MPLQSLNSLRPLRRALVNGRRLVLTRVWGMDVHPTAQFSLTTKFDRTYPRGVHVAAYSYVAFGTAILTHDRTRGLYLHTYVEEDCFIGAESIVLPGVRIGRGSVVGAGSVVTQDVPPGSLVVGNPARVIREGIEVGRYGRFTDANATEARLRAAGAWGDA